MSRAPGTHLEGVHHDHLNAVLVQQLPRARQVLGDPLVIREGRFIEAAPIDEGALFGPAAPDQVAALFEAVEQGSVMWCASRKSAAPAGYFHSA